MSWNPQHDDPYSSPYHQASYGQGPSRGRSWIWLWALLGGGGAAFLFLCCGACAWVANFGLQITAEEIKAELKDHPVVVEHIGHIQSIEVNYAASLSEDDDTVWTYDVVGSKGSGTLIVKEEDNWESDTVVIEWARLQLDTGEEFNLLP